MQYFNNYQEIVCFILEHHITTINQFINIICVTVLPLTDCDEESDWIANHVDGTFGLVVRLILVRADLPNNRNKLATLHESGHILLGHQGNFKLSSLPQTGSPEEHEANMVAYCLLMLFSYYDTNIDRKSYEEIADAYEIPYSELGNLKEAHDFVNSQLQID